MPTVNDASGTPQRVNEKGFALGMCIMLPMSAHAADEGLCYSVVIAADPGGTDADFFYLKNNSDHELRIYKIKAAPPVLTTEISIKVGVTGTPTSGTAVTPVNALVGDGNTADCTAELRDGDMALSGGHIFDVLHLNKDFLGEQAWDYPGGIALEKNQALVFNNDIDPTSDLDMTVYFYFHPKIA